MAETKISPYDLPTLKNTTDDALQNYLSSISFKQSHFLTDVRLAIGYIAVLIGAATFLADYKLGWNATKDWTAVAVVVYFGLNGAFTYWMWAVERGVVFEGSRQGKKVGCSSLAGVRRLTVVWDRSTLPPGLRSTILHTA